MSRGERAVLEEYLRERGQKMTSPRETVLDAFLELERHVTAEELLGAARRIDPSIGQATVFRTIKLLAEAGLAREACLEDGARHFEHAYRHEHHDHLVCVSCGGVVEFKDEAIERAQEAIYRKHGFRPSDHRLELLGTCPSCARRSGNRAVPKAIARKRGG
jgi:Fur family transcriptional regulator, ferric uptake regulator